MSGPSGQRVPPIQVHHRRWPMRPEWSPPRILDTAAIRGGWTMRAWRRIWGICTRPPARRQLQRWPSPPPSPAAVRPAASRPEGCAAVLATCERPRRTGRGLEPAETAACRGLVDAAIVASLFHGGAAPQRGGGSALGRHRARRWRHRHRPPLQNESGRRSPRRLAPSRRLRGRAARRLQPATAPKSGASRRRPKVVPFGDRRYYFSRVRDPAAWPPPVGPRTPFRTGSKVAV